LSRWLLALPLAVFGVGGLVLYALFVTQAGEGAIRENLLPELIGFCLEGFFLVGLLTFVQRLREDDRRRELRLSLRGAMRDFLSHLDLAFLEADAEPASTRDLETQPRVVLRLLASMKETELDADSMVALKRVAIYTLPLAQDLIAVAAQLSTSHMRWWIAIVEAIKKLSEADTREEVERPLLTLMVSLAEFDALKL
jgi:hypothetical protein